MKLNEKVFLIYKLFNSAFTGLSIGILFTIYQPLEDPSIYSLGGMVLAIGMLIVAKFYDKLLNIKDFLRRTKKKHYKQKINIVGMDIKPEFPKKPDIVITNDFKKSIKYMSNEISLKLDKFFL